MMGSKLNQCKMLPLNLAHLDLTKKPKQKAYPEDNNQKSLRGDIAHCTYGLLKSGSVKSDRI